MAAVPSVGRASSVESAAPAPEADVTRALFERYANQIFGYCLHQLGSREEAEDAVQSTFLNAFRGLCRGVVPEAEQAWLFKIAQNVCLSRRRSTWRRGRIESPADFEVAEETTAAPTRRADELIGLQDVLENMPENQRRAILLREWQGLSYREIAEELELSQAAVETLIFRARRALAQGLEASPVEQRSWRARLRPTLDLGGLAGWLQSFLGSGAAVKAAGTVAFVAVGSAVVAPEAHHLRTHVHAAPAPAAAPKHASTAASSSLHAVAPAAPAAAISPPRRSYVPIAAHIPAPRAAAPTPAAPPVQAAPAAAPPPAAAAPSETASVRGAAPPDDRRDDRGGRHDRSAGGQAETKEHGRRRGDEGRGREQQQPRHDHRSGSHDDAPDRGTAPQAQAKTPTGQAKGSPGKEKKEKQENRQNQAAAGQSQTQTGQPGSNGKNKTPGQVNAPGGGGTSPGQADDDSAAGANAAGNANGNGNGNGHQKDAAAASDPSAPAAPTQPPAAPGNAGGHDNGNGHNR